MEEAGATGGLFASATNDSTGSKLPVTPIKANPLFSEWRYTSSPRQNYDSVAADPPVGRPHTHERRVGNRTVGPETILLLPRAFQIK